MTNAWFVRVLPAMLLTLATVTTSVRAQEQQPSSQTPFSTSRPPGAIAPSATPPVTPASSPSSGAPSVSPALPGSTSSAPSSSDPSAAAASSQPSASSPSPVPGDAITPSQPIQGAEPTGDSAGASDATQDAAAPAAAPASDASSSTLPQDLSPWGMFMQADIIVKAVMIGLAFASLVTWTIWLARGLDLAASRRRAQSCLRKLERADTLAAARAEISEGWTGKGPVSDLMEAAENECRRSNDLSSEGIKERLAIALSRIEAKSGRDIARGTGLLATIGATAPFVGLFGTVWGIMNSFIGISHSKTTNLAVVAPGIAEALLATALGLVAAIPAVIIYNVFARALSSYRALLSDASGEIIQHISRDLERQERGLGPSVVPLSRGRSAAE
ncbi:MAG: tonB-system energizer ExbB [Nitrobacter sp. 62-23]|nr:MAG: tonB-system energizer ExbB [Nitrobacter sp. 62-23]